jgi:hypothetical protein
MAQLEARLPPGSLVPLLADVHDAEQVDLDALAWQRPTSQLLDFDKRVHDAEERVRHAARPLILAPRGELEPDLALLVASQIVTRYQRLFWRQNQDSTGARFELLLGRLRALHDLGKPLVRADFDHALDVWQWVLQLRRDASEGLQIAALFHDVERLSSEPERRIEHQAGDYLAFKRRHAAEGARRLAAELHALGYSEPEREHACRLVREHEQPGDDPELNLLNDADGLSFFALNSPGYLAYFGAEQTRKKVAYTLRRMGERARSLLQHVRLAPAVERWIDALAPV